MHRASIQEQQRTTGHQLITSLPRYHAALHDDPSKEAAATTKPSTMSSSAPSPLGHQTGVCVYACVSSSHRKSRLVHKRIWTLPHRSIQRPARPKSRQSSQHGPHQPRRGTCATRYSSASRSLVSPSIRLTETQQKQAEQSPRSEAQRRENDTPTHPKTKNHQTLHIPSPILRHAKRQPTSLIPLDPHPSAGRLLQPRHLLLVHDQLARRQPALRAHHLAARRPPARPAPLPPREPALQVAYLGPQLVRRRQRRRGRRRGRGRRRHRRRAAAPVPRAVPRPMPGPLPRPVTRAVARTLARPVTRRRPRQRHRPDRHALRHLARHPRLEDDGRRAARGGGEGGGIVGGGRVVRGGGGVRARGGGVADDGPLDHLDRRQRARPGRRDDNGRFVDLCPVLHALCDDFAAVGAGREHLEITWGRQPANGRCCRGARTYSSCSRR